MPRGRKRDPVDVYVGNQLRTRRTLNGFSQTELAEQLDITFQQLQKYENGANRMSASRLWYVSKVLGVPVSYFFEGLDGSVDPASDVLSTRAGLEFVRDFDACSKEVRKCASSLCKAIADAIAPAAGKET